MGTTVIYEKKDKIGIIKLNRPEVLNAINDALIEDFLLVFQLAQKDDTRVIILRGEGRAFSAGADVKEGSQPRSIEDYFNHAIHMQDMTRVMAHSSKPVIAAVQGYALGGGCELALNCDIRIAAEGTKFGFPETTVGATVTNAGLYNLPRLIGMGRAKELIYTGRRVDAKEAEAWGMVNKVVPVEELDKATMELADEIASHDPLGITLARHCLDSSAETSFESLLRLETFAATTSFASGKRQTGMKQAIKKKS